MAIKFETITEALEFVDEFDGYGMICTDEDLQVDRLREFDLIDDYQKEED